MPDLWKNAKLARTAIDEQAEDLLNAFNSNDNKHVKTWLSLTTEERRTLLKHPHKTKEKWAAKLADNVSNVAYYLLTRTPKRPEDALVILDDLVEVAGRTQVDVWKNALWAVMPDNTDLPLDREKCLYYLEKCTPHAQGNAGVYWNIACVHKHLGDVDACIDALEKAKAQGEDMEGPRDEPFFRDLWDNERFAAVFEGMEPPIYSFEQGDKLDSVPDPKVVRSIKLEVKKHIPKKLRDFTSVEVLEIDGDFTTFPEWLTELTKLRKLKFWCWALKKIPDEVLCMPSLEEIETYSSLPRGYDAKAINQLLKSFQKNDVAAEARPIHLSLLVGRSTKTITDTQMVEALGSTATKVHRKALAELDMRWKKRTCELKEGDEIVVIGRLSADRSVLKERLARLKVTSKKKVSKKTAAIVIGPRHGGKALPFLEGDIPVVLEKHLHDELDRKDKRHFDQAGDEGESEQSAAQLSELLLAADENSASLALEMIKRGGLPDGLLEELFLVAQTQDFPRKVRNTAKTLFERYASAESVKAVHSELKRTNIFASGETKLARRLDALEKKSDGQLNGEKIARAMFARSRDGLKYLLKKAKKGAPTLELLKLAQQGSELTLSGFDLTRIPDEVAKLEGVAKLDACGNRINKLTSGLFELTKLVDLDLSGNALQEVPPDIEKLKNLRKLDLSHNLFTGLPPSVAALSDLEELNFSSESYSHKMKMQYIRQDLSGLKSLKKLILRSHNFEKLPESLKDLHALEALELGWGNLKELPAWLTELPALKTLEVQYLRYEDEEAANKVLASLEEKGVTVER